MAVQTRKNKGIQLQDSDFADANKLLSTKGKTFYWARFLLNKCHAQRATRLYRFCRYVDDLADEAHSVAHAKKNLKKLGMEIIKNQSDDLIVLDALDLFKECGIEKAIVFELINGVSSDLAKVRVQDVNQLLHYCYQVAGTVGIMMCKVLDIEDKTAYPYAIDLGIAMQLTNICRDVREDALMGRRYLPATLVGNLEPAKLISPNHSSKQPLSDAIANLLAIADSYYKSGNVGLPFISFRARTGILIASKLYQAIGIKLQKQDYQYWQKRALLSKFEKLILSIKTLTTLLFSRKFWKVVTLHDKDLHQTLTSLPYTHVS